ncbi:TPA: hypothetical protein I7737_21730 [Vibrio vulnificus]|nr:hypothetical protein [Vibrio vulnificus]
MAFSLRSIVAKRASHLNAALGAVRKLLYLIFFISLAICSGSSAIWLYRPKFLNHSTCKTC